MDQIQFRIKMYNISFLKFATPIQHLYIIIIIIINASNVLTAHL